MRDKIRELIKSVILVVLFLTTILLLYLVFIQNNNVSIENLLPFRPSQTESIITASEVAIPQEVVYSAGGAEHINVEDKVKYYQRLTVYLKDFTSQGSSMATEITKDQFDSAVKEYESIQFNFRYNIPFAQYCDENDISRSSGYSSIENVNNIVLSSAANDSVLIYDGVEKYYRILSESAHDWQAEILNGEEITGDTIYTVREVLGADNDASIPVFVQKETENVAYEYERMEEDTPAFNEIAETIFGETLSFVRRIEDSFGNLTYMYGFGDKTLSIQADGTMEYKNTSTASGSPNGFYSDLQTAINFAYTCGGWSDKTGDAKFNLSYVGTSANARTFFFTQSINGEQIIGDDQVAMRIVVENGQVTSYSRHAIIASANITAKENVIEAANALSDIANNVYKEYLINQGLPYSNINQQEAYSYAASQIQRIRICYKPEDGQLIPSWCFDFQDGGRVWTGLKQRQF